MSFLSIPLPIWVKHIFPELRVQDIFTLFLSDKQNYQLLHSTPAIQEYFQILRQKDDLLTQNIINEVDKDLSPFVLFPTEPRPKFLYNWRQLNPYIQQIWINDHIPDLLENNFPLPIINYQDEDETFDFLISFWKSATDDSDILSTVMENQILPFPDLNIHKLDYQSPRLNQIWDNAIFDINTLELLLENNFPRPVDQNYLHNYWSSCVINHLNSEYLGTLFQYQFPMPDYNSFPQELKFFWCQVMNCYGCSDHRQKKFELLLKNNYPRPTEMDLDSDFFSDFWMKIPLDEPEILDSLVKYEFPFPKSLPYRVLRDFWVHYQRSDEFHRIMPCLKYA